MKSARTRVATSTTKARLTSNWATIRSAIHGSATRKTIVPVTAAPMIAQASTSQRPQRRTLSIRRHRSMPALRSSLRRSRRSGGTRSGTARPALCTISCSVPSGQSQPQKNPRPTRARTSTVPARTRLEVCTWATVRPVVHTVQAPSIPPNGHPASADSPPDGTWPTACQPTTAITTAWIACRAQRVFAPQAAARRGTRPGHRWCWGSGPFVLLAWSSTSPPGGPGCRVRPDSASPRQDGRQVRRTDGSQMEKVWRRNSGWSATAVDHVLQMFPVDVYPLEACRSQIVQLLVKGNDVAHVVVVARLLLRRAVEALACRLGVVAIVHSLPGGFDNVIRRAHRVVVDVPTARGEALDDLGEQALLSVIR